MASLLHHAQEYAARTSKDVDAVLGRFYKTPVEEHDFRDRTALITDGSSDISIAVARHYAEQGARVVLACEDRETAKAARDRVLQTHAEARVETMSLEFGSLASVRSFYDVWKAQIENDRGINFLHLNGDVVYTKRSTSPEGHESTYSANALTHFTLALELLEFMPIGARMVFSTADIFSSGKVTSSTLNGEDLLKDVAEGAELPEHVATKLNQRSKSIQALVAYELGRALNETSRQISVFSVFAGILETKLSDSGTGHHRSFNDLIVRYCSLPMEECASVLFRAGTEPSMATPGNNGSFYDRTKRKWMPAWFRERKVVDGIIEQMQKDAGITLKDAVDRDAIIGRPRRNESSG